MPRGAGLPSAYRTCTSMIPPGERVPPMPGLCAWRHGHRRQKKSSKRKKRDEVQNMSTSKAFRRARGKKDAESPPWQDSPIIRGGRERMSKKKGAHRGGRPQGLRLSLEVDIT